MKRVLVLSPTYLPGYRGGGPVRTLSTLIEWLGDDFQFQIVTSNQDLGLTKPYENLTSEGSYQVGKARVRYLPPERMKVVALAKILKELEYDLLYLNSFFASMCIKVMFLRRAGLIPPKPVIVSPRGVFQPSALRIKRWKKTAYLYLASALELYEGVLWHTADPTERENVLTALPVEPENVVVSPYLLSTAVAHSEFDGGLLKTVGSASVVFFSRISKMKNLDFAIELFNNVQGNIRFDVYGPIEDHSLWARCKELSERLPPTVQLRYCHSIEPDRVRATLAQYHLFLLPTRGENYGYAILEALSSGCLALISDRTPWCDLSEKGAGWSLPLSQPDAFSRAISEVAAMDQATFCRRSRKAVSYARDVAADSAAVEANRRLFQTALQR